MNTGSLPAWIRWILAVCSGLVLPLAFAPTDYWPLAIICLSVLYALLQQVSTREAALIGWLFGLGYFGIGVHWIYHSLHLFGEAIAPLAALLTLVFVLVMTVFPCLTAWFWARFRTRGSVVVDALFFAALWVCLELLRGKIMNGFPWILVGYSQTTGPLMDLARFVGVYGLSFLIVLLSALLVVVVFDSTRRITALVVIAVMVLLVFPLRLISFSSPVGEPLQVRLVQANIAQETKFSRERLRQSIELYTQLTQRPGLERINLVVWPETAIPTHYHRIEAAIEPFVAQMDARGIDVLSGVFQKDGEQEVYNAVRQLGGDRAVYRKRHLVPFGEYMPLRPLLAFAADYIDIPMSDLSSGSGPHVPLVVQGVPVGVSICYEDVYGEEMRALLPASRVLVNVSNDAWFGNSAAPHQHEQKARMRALEFERPMVRVTNTGVSSMIDYRGGVLGRIGHDTLGILDIQVQPRDGATLYSRTGNWPVFLVSLCIVLLAISLSLVRGQQQLATH